MALDLLGQQRRIDLADVQVGFYGANPTTVNDFVRPYRCASCVQPPTRLPYLEMLERQKASQILLMVASAQQGGAIPAKLYLYLGSRRPILNVLGDGAGTDRIIEQTKSGITSSDPNEIACWIEKAYHEWKNKGLVTFSWDEAEIHKYSRKTQAGQVADILNTITHQ